MGTIRYYRVPASNRLLPGTSAFWPSVEILHEYRKTDNGETGELPWDKRPEERGANFRPDLTGNHPSGTADDFAGRTIVPLAQPAEPACVAFPDLRLTLLFAGEAIRPPDPAASFKILTEDSDPIATEADDVLNQEV